MKFLILFQSTALCDRLSVLLLLCLSATRSESFQVIPHHHGTLSSSSSAEVARSVNPNTARSFTFTSVLYSKADKGEEHILQEEISIAGAKTAATALVMDEMTNEEFVEMDLGAVADNNETSVNSAIHDEVTIAEAPPLSFSKFLTMQGKRVIVTIRYSGEAGLKPYFLTAAKKIKASHPDVILERRQIADMVKEDPGAEPSFEILVDGKVVVGNNKSRSRKKIGNVDLSRSQSIFVSMQELDLAISRARRRRRPATTVYGEVHEPAEVQNSLRLEGLRDGDVPPIPVKSTTIVKKQHAEWND
eukprot:scaffold7349_cov173-Amphora_coffeaeformis.AAC.33